MPILKEFDLDIPYISNVGTQEDYEVTWKQKRVQFRDEIRCIASLYERFFGKFRTLDSWKVLIECVNEVTDQRILDFTGVCKVQVEFHVASFFSMNIEAKKQTTLELLKKGIDTIVAEKAWDPTPFDQAFQKVMQAELKNEWYWKKPLFSPNRKQKASLLIVHEVTDVKAYLIISHRNNELILRSEIFRARPNEWAFARYLGEIQWLSQNEVVLLDKNKEVVGSTILF